MDLLAALSLVLVIEGMAAMIFASSLPELLAALRGVGAQQMRMVGILMTLTGGALYLLIRG
ncbi:MAG: DUF2065 family protein [Paracoccaceae bacterium]|nr:DUF2065 family protein [Paracoccaceae bacterium]